MLPRTSTALALLLVILGMFWLGNACCDSTPDNDPVGTVECLGCKVESTDKRQPAAVFPVRITGYNTQVTAKRIGQLDTKPTACSLHRPQKHAVRGPPSLDA